MIRKLLLWSPMILFCIILALALLRALGWFAIHTASLLITNGSATEITDIDASLFDRPCHIERLAPGDSGLCKFRVRADSHYTLEWTESNDRDYREQAGYVTPGFDFNHRIDLLGSGEIAFTTE